MDLVSGKPIDPRAEGILDNFCVKQQMIESAAAIAGQLLLVDEIIVAGALKRDTGMPM